MNIRQAGKPTMEKSEHFQFLPYSVEKRIRMTLFCKKHFLILALVFISHFVWTQSNEIKIRFIGNCGLYLTDGETNIYIDFPYKSGAHHYMEYDESEISAIKENPILIFTHKHSDHFSRKEVRKLNGKLFGPWNVKKLEQLNASVPDFSIQYFKTKHRFSLNHYSYLITWHGKKLYFSGDTEHAETIGAMQGLDYAFVPYWLLYDAKEKNIRIDTRMRVVYHLYPNQKITGEKPDDMILLDRQGMIISVPY